MLNSIVKLLRAASSSRLDTLSRQAADLSLESVCQIVGDRIEGMTFSEARGYIRARAARVVRKQACQVITEDPGAHESWIDAVTRAATEQLVPVVLRQTRVGVPEQAAPLRMAA